MRFTKISEQQVYDCVVLATGKLHESGFLDSPIAGEEILSQLPKIDHSCTTDGIKLVGQNEYQFHLIRWHDSNTLSVIRCDVDLDDPADSCISDISANLGELDPSHPSSDARCDVTMAIIYAKELIAAS